MQHVHIEPIGSVHRQPYVRMEADRQLEHGRQEAVPKLLVATISLARAVIHCRVHMMQRTTMHIKIRCEHHEACRHGASVQPRDGGVEDSRRRLGKHQLVEGLQQDNLGTGNGGRLRLRRAYGPPRGRADSIAHIVVQDDHLVELRQRQGTKLVEGL